MGAMPWLAGTLQTCVLVSGGRSRPLTLHLHRRRSLTLVSARWRDLFYSQPELWRAFTVRLPSIEKRPEEEWQRCVDGRLALLLRMAPHVAAFSWQGGDEARHNWRGSDDEEEEGSWQGSSDEEAGYAAMPAFYARLSAFLAALRPEQLVELELLDLSSLSAACQASLQQLAGVTRLSLSGATADLPLSALDHLRSRPRSLCLEAFVNSELLMRAIGRPSAKLSELTELQLRLPNDDGRQLLLQLTGLTRLRSLTVESSQKAKAWRAAHWYDPPAIGGGAQAAHNGQRAPPPAMPLPTNFPAGLESFTFALERMQARRVG